MTVSQAALDRYAVRLRRERLRYRIALAVVLVAASVIAAVVWLHGEISHTTLHTVAKAPANVALGTPSSVQHELWSTTDKASMGTPNSGGTVVTYDTHTVRGRDARTGKQTWYYTRTDRTVCAAMQVEGITVAVYKLNGNCDELTGLNSGTGRRKWTRTLDEDTHQLNGVPQFSISGTTVMFVSPAVIYAINTTNGYDAWRYPSNQVSTDCSAPTCSKPNCTIERAVLGSAGALISQTCAHQACVGLKHCLNGQQLLLRDANAGENTDSSKNGGNADQIFWAVNTALVPASAGSVVTAFNRDGGSLNVLDAKTGKVTSGLPLQSSNGAALDLSTDTELADADLIWSGGTTYAVTASDKHVAWHQTSDAAPTVTTGSDGLPAALGNALVVAPSTRGVDVLNPQTGASRKTYPISPLPSSTALVFPLGTGFIVEGGTTVTVYS